MTTPAHPQRRSAESVRDTPTRILDAAELLFVDRGYAATSVRAIAERAGVNLGAAHYHFGSKQALFGAVVERCFAPIQEQRDRALDALLAQSSQPSVREIVEAFLVPLSASPAAEAPRLIARLFGEPTSISQPLIEAQFGPSFERFTEAFQRALPELESTEIRWRFHFAIGAMIHTLATAGPISAPSVSRHDAIDRLTAFATAGFITPPDAPRAQEKIT